MTRDEFEYLCSSQARELIERYIDSEPSSVALKIRNAAVATQIKNLQKCRAKLPTYYAARCIIPTVSYQQSSSEAVAFSKEYSGGVAVDLTCGLGVDSLALSRRFERVVAVEIDPVRVEIARYNFQRLGATNVEVICTSAEQYIDQIVRVDLIYVDPHRRDESGNSVYAVEDCQPNVLQMVDKFRAKSERTIIKLSPLFDVEQAYRLFGDNVRCRVISLQNECKEVVVEIAREPQSDMQIVAIHDSQTEQFTFPRQAIGRIRSVDVEPRYLCVPDIGFYKSRTVGALMGGEKYNYTEGYVLTEEPPERFCGAVYAIQEMLPYQPKVLRKRFPKAIVHIRDFPYTMEQIEIRQGGSVHLFFTMHNQQAVVFLVKNTLSSRK